MRITTVGDEADDIPRRGCRQERAHGEPAGEVEPRFFVAAMQPASLNSPTS